MRDGPGEKSRTPHRRQRPVRTLWRAMRGRRLLHRAAISGLLALFDALGAVATYVAALRLRFDGWVPPSLVELESTGLHVVDCQEVNTDSPL